MTVLVLQTLAVERSTPSGRSHQEAASPRIGSTPDLVTDALEAEHRIECVERECG